MKKYAFGIDVGGTTCKIGFFETNGKLIDKWEIKTNTENNGAAILSDIAQAVDNKLAQEGISKDDVQGVGIGVPGPVKSNGVVNRCVNLGWGIVNVEEELVLRSKQEMMPTLQLSERCGRGQQKAVKTLSW